MGCYPRPAKTKNLCVEMFIRPLKIVGTRSRAAYRQIMAIYGDNKAAIEAIKAVTLSTKGSSSSCLSFFRAEVLERK